MIVSGAFWLFLRVRTEPALFCPTTALPKESEEGVALTATIPLPLRVTFCGLLVPLSLTVRVALREPRAAGVNVTEIVQLLPEPRLDGQLFVWL